MKKVKRQLKSALNLPSITLEGALFLPDQLEKAARGEHPKYQTEADYQTPKGLRLKDDYSRAFQIACAQWKHFAPTLEREDVDALAITQSFVEELLRDAFGYTLLQKMGPVHVNDRAYPVTFLAGHVPVVVSPFNTKLDDSLELFAIEGSGSRKKSAFQLAQELLNASDTHLWALVSNGKQLRLLRDAASLTRPSFLEFDLQDVLEGQRFSEFASVWRLIHASRAALTGKPENSIWEAWREIGKQEGTRVRDGLRKGVEQALLVLGEGFIQHSANQGLREQLDKGELSKYAYFQQLLRLIYRLIFLFTVEERGVLHPHPKEGEKLSKEKQLARRAYLQGYALNRLRDACLKRRNLNRFDDHWQALRIVFNGLAEGEPRLDLPALGGLFNATQCPNLDNASLSNKHLLAAMRHLRWANHDGTPTPVDYRNMGPEELGSVYESLLELVPEINLQAKTFGFIGITSEGSNAGNARKTSGSYYTPDSLVQELIKSALEPVIAQRLAENKANPTEALLSIRVIDPACGSGHFLLAAARRLAQELAQLRAEDGAVKPQDYRHALHEVISHCIFGVDRNPMALELARTALWLEGFEEGQPLSFLDHHLQCGDALLGLTDLKALKYGIPKAAFKPLSGDEKTVCSLLAKTNANALKDLNKKRNAAQFKQLDEFLKTDSGLEELAIIEAMPQNTTKQIAKKESSYLAFLEKAKNSHVRYAADMVVGAFLLTKTEQSQQLIPTTENVFLESETEQHNAQHLKKREAASEICAKAKVFHWPLAFPQVFSRKENSGFDCVLANPPWERIKLQEEEFFATRSSQVAAAKNKAERSQRIQWLSEGMLAKHLLPDMEHAEHECEAEIRIFNEFTEAKRTAEAASIFAHVNSDEGGRYPLTGVGDVNTYALFSETILQITSENGRAGFIVPTGIATDSSTKAFFGNLISHKKLVSLFDFDNSELVFPSVASLQRFCLITIGLSKAHKFAFLLKSVLEMQDERRSFDLEAEDFKKINPNTLTCPILISRKDADLAKKIYFNVPVLINTESNLNPWGISFLRMFDMSNDSEMFNYKLNIEAASIAIGHVKLQDENNYYPLYEAKMMTTYDHRFGSYPEGKTDDTRALPRLKIEEKNNPKFEVNARFYVSGAEIKNKIGDYKRSWFFCFRSMSNHTNLRRFISGVIPYAALGNSLIACKIGDQIPLELAACLMGNLSCLVLDAVARWKVSGTNLNLFLVEQFPVIPPTDYSKHDQDFVLKRVVELVYTTESLRGFALDCGYDGKPFPFDTERRARLMAELDAFYARKYRLSRDDLRYILYPPSVMGEGYPSETFRVLKDREMQEFGEYRTQRLVLEAWDKLEHGELS